MKITREDIRKALVEALQVPLATVPEDRIKYPGMPEIDVSINKTLHVNVDLVYMDGWSAELGENSNQRLMGNIVVEVVFKEGQPQDRITANNLLDDIQAVVSNTDKIKPIRTFGSRQVTPVGGAIQGMIREGLLTPFWYDTSR